MLRTHRWRQLEERLRAGEAWAATDYVFCFCDTLREPLSPDWVSSRFHALVRAAGLPRVRFHDLRHTAASLMLANGVPVKIVSEMLGHANPTITLAGYAHLLPNMAQEAGERLSASLLR
ncbi:MAG TPA: tyrosine-type recombinase/integrase [Acidimicrobiales bacterium]|jgi:integrase|nr:tyrosine-type recombinase/integrase [Acidimicrobiales bacterium]